MSDADRLRRRRWSFADCVFDEASWTLTVGGRRVPAESKPLELLRELLQNAGNVVSKGELLDAIWPDVMVVEASLPTAVHKLRQALDDDRRPTQLIETVPRIGYRLAVEVEELAGAANGEVSTVSQPATTATRRGGFGRRSALAIAGGLTLVVAATAYSVFSPERAPAVNSVQPYSLQAAITALRRLDVEAIDRMLAAGWNPDMRFDEDGNNALHYVLNICEWNRDHDRNRLVLMVRTLHDGGARLERRNVWGDTPYSIARAPRYCGPDHPVTMSLRAACYNGFRPLGDRCLASYEIARRDSR